MKKWIGVFIFATPLVSACSPGEEYRQPEIPPPASWNALAASSPELLYELRHNNAMCMPAPKLCEAEKACPADACAVSKNWWESLSDAALNALIDKALNNNHDLKIAEARILEARALAGETLSKLLPSIDATGSASRLGGQENLGNSNKPNNQWQAGASASWVIDLFGQSRAELAAAQAGAVRAEKEYRGAMLTLISEVARTYVEMRALQQRMALTQKNLSLEEETLRVTRIQYEAQAVSKLDILRANAQVETTRAELPTIDALLAASYHRLAVLTGEAPGNMEQTLKEAAPMPEFSEKILLDTPASVIAQRPDIQAAEANLIQATSLKNAATAEIFPKLTLSGFFGTGGASLFTTSNPWNVGASALMPLLDFGRIESRIDAADARKIQAFHAYKQTVLKALEEVENAMVSYHREIRRAQSLDEAAESNREAVRLARIKYRVGDATFLDLLIVEERLLTAESDAVISHANAAKAAVMLHTALGMGAASFIPPMPQENAHE